MGKLTAIFLGGFLVTAFPTASCNAAEIVTRCPSASPIDGKSPIYSVDLLHFGDMALGGGIETALAIEGARHSYDLVEMEASDFRRAALECAYGEIAGEITQIVKVPIPGLLLRCEIISRRVSAHDREWDLERYWCTSRVE